MIHYPQITSIYMAGNISRIRHYRHFTSKIGQCNMYDQIPPVSTASRQCGSNIPHLQSCVIRLMFPHKTAACWSHKHWPPLLHPPCHGTHSHTYNDVTQRPGHLTQIGPLKAAAGGESRLSVCTRRDCPEMSLSPVTQRCVTVYLFSISGCHVQHESCGQMPVYSVQAGG